MTLLSYVEARVLELHTDGPEQHGGANAGPTFLSARERFFQSAGGSAARPFIPASRLCLPVLAKPPPHMVEMATGTPRQNPMPAERPMDITVSGGSKRKRNGEN
jgi:hypothetical protein